MCLPSAFAGGFRLAQLVLIERHPKNWPFIAAMALSASCESLCHIDKHSKKIRSDQIELVIEVH